MAEDAERCGCCGQPLPVNRAEAIELMEIRIENPAWVAEFARRLSRRTDS